MLQYCLIWNRFRSHLHICTVSRLSLEYKMCASSCQSNLPAVDKPQNPKLLNSITQSLLLLLAVSSSVNQTSMTQSQQGIRPVACTLFHSVRTRVSMVLLDNIHARASLIEIARMCNSEMNTRHSSFDLIAYLRRMLPYPFIVSLLVISIVSNHLLAVNRPWHLLCVFNVPFTS